MPDALLSRLIDRLLGPIARATKLTRDAATLALEPSRRPAGTAVH